MKQGDIVSYQVHNMKGKARVVGVSSSAQPVIGRMLILEDLSGNIPNETYPYTHFTAPEVLLEKTHDT